MCTRPRAVLLAALLCGLSLFGADFNMKVTDSGYLDAQGFSVILYHSCGLPKSNNAELKQFPPV